VIPRDPERNDVFDLHSGEQALNVFAYEVLEENEMISLHVFIDRNKPWQDGGDFDECISLGHLDAARLLENGHEVEAKVAEKRKRVPASTARGVRMGKTWTSKYSSSRFLSFLSSSSMRWMKTFTFLSRGAPPP